jgi:hypothetical protein
MISDEDKKRIEEEEKLRAELKEKYKNPNKVKSTKNKWIFVTIVFIGFIFFWSYYLAAHPSTYTPAAQPRELGAQVSADNLSVNIYNDENEIWADCVLNLNAGYKVKADLKPGKNPIAYSNFTTSDHERFDYSKTRPAYISISCENPLGEFSSGW